MTYQVNLDTLKAHLRRHMDAQGKTFAQVAKEAGLSSNGLHNKLYRQTITVGDLMAVLDVLGLTLTIEETEDTQGKQDRR